MEENEAILEVAKLMCLAARTAPKARGIDRIVTKIVTDEKEAIASKMEEIGRTQPKVAKIFSRDVINLRQAPVVVLVGSKLGTMELDCGYCGFSSCEELKNNGKARCSYVPGDLGIALGSAVSVAGLHHVDNRVMYSIGYAAQQLNLLGEEVKLIYAIPLSATGKNIFFDRH
ncbi:MAG TPA: ferredoxin [Elusimicrobia bacterium]|jgi:uncharacterized ferredoxin-like protein|nr:ferredoxin [Elusimicrobiota bacterium]